MTHPFYCQMDYRTLPLAASLKPEKREEIISCCCASSMLVEGMLDLCFPPEECFRFASECGLEDCTGELFPVYCGALAGTAYPVDRFALSESLDFTMPSPNSLDAVSDRDFACDFLCSPVSPRELLAGNLPHVLTSFFLPVWQGRCSPLSHGLDDEVLLRVS